MIRELVVLSGKGGTGKTSITAAFAAFSSGSVVADGDVDASNLHLLLSPRVMESGDFSGGHEAFIREDDCFACGLCARICRFDAISRVNGSFRITHCEGCGVCVERCPAKAIDWKSAHTGTWMISDALSGPMVHARLRPGAENSGKLVSLVREMARKQAAKHEIDTILIDGPPGIGCPAIASLTGVHAALVVTEPTPSGLHDLKRILELTRHFSVPTRVLINKADLNQEMAIAIVAESKERGCPIAGMLPYSHEFTQAQMESQPIPLRFPDSGIVRQLREIWKETHSWLKA